MGMSDRTEHDLSKARGLLELSQGALRLACDHNVQADKVIKGLQAEVAALRARNGQMEQALERASQISGTVAELASQTWPYAPLYLNGRELPGRIVEEDLVRRICKEGAELSACVGAMLPTEERP